MRAHRGLLGLCIGLAVVETALINWVGPHAALALAPQASAVAPFGVFHDLRWLLVYSQSWLTLAVEAIGFLLVRAAITTATVLFAWPEDVPRPSRLVIARRALGYTAAAIVLLSVSASLLVGLAVASVSYLFFAAVPLALFLALLIHQGPVVPWWRAHPTLRTVGWTALSFAVLTLGGAAVSATPWPAPLVVAGAVGLFNAWAWLGIVRSLAARRSTRFVPLAPVGIATLGAIVVIGVVAALALQDAHGRLPRDHTPAALVDPNGQPVLVLTGFASHWRGHGDQLDLGPGFRQERFSYAGLDATGRPQAFVAADTDQPLPRLVRLLDRQVHTFAGATHSRIDVISDSEGALIAKAYLLMHPDAPVQTLVLTSPLVQPGRAYLPPAGEEGFGLAAGWSLRGVGAALRAISPLDVSPDGPFIRSVDDHGPLLQGALECPLPHTAQLALFPLADAVGAPYDATNEVPAAVVASFHGKLFDEARSLHTIGDYLRTGVVPGYPGLRLTERLVRAASAAWQVPTLGASLNPVWRSAGTPDTCSEMAAALRAWTR